jgi:hypothetical protein
MISDSLELDEHEKLEIKQMLVDSTKYLMKQLENYASEISNSQSLNEDTETCYFEMKTHKHLTNLCFHLYNTELSTYSKRDFCKIICLRLLTLGRPALM